MRRRFHFYDIKGPCRVLEMLTALSIKCEEHIMSNPKYGDRTSLWFWGMIESLGLMDMIDTCFDADYVDFVLDRLENRKYRKNGSGGLFTIHDTRCDMRNVEIWKQMCWYLDEIIEEGEEF